MRSAMKVMRLNVLKEEYSLEHYEINWMNEKYEFSILNNVVLRDNWSKNDQTFLFEQRKFVLQKCIRSAKIFPIQGHDIRMLIMY